MWDYQVHRAEVWEEIGEGGIQSHPTQTMVGHAGPVPESSKMQPHSGGLPSLHR
jgi:hypothetical protein